MSVSKQSLAYDLTLFDESLEAPKPELKEIPKPKKRLITPGVAVLNVFLCILVVSVLTVIMVGNARLNELTLEISSANKQLAALQDEEKKLNVELDRRIDLRNIEEYAKNNLGMQKLMKSQIIYVNLSGEDEAVIVDNGKSDVWDWVTSHVSGIFRSIQEYFN